MESIEGSSKLLKYKKGSRAIKISIFLYLILSVSKIVAGMFAQSEALTADGWNNVSDVLASITLMIGMYISQKPADHNHRYGHFRAETTAALLAAFMMAVVGIDVLKGAFMKLWRPEEQVMAPDPLSMYVAFGGALILYLLSLYNMSVGKETDNLAVMAAAYDNRSDAIISIGTLIGIGTARLGWLWADALVALIVGLLIIKTAYVVGKQAVDSLMDAFEEEKWQEIHDRIMEVNGVSRVTDLRARYHGSAVHVDCIIEVPSSLTVEESHDVTDRIEEHLKGFNGIERMLIHVEPASCRLNKSRT
ncbi:cation transporter [Brevibacillus laterosporus]|uniref:cation diffusion facilitator family transporter n=1 Tax=Brevibacillus laterosporus TaxID=1465 RepID=UPI002405D064|nr:cation diffusion facilitator family transporter [Brevibacillus laterosporus]MDF9413324.1 cation transporter [Brevibacillus laterosporus]